MLRSFAVLTMPNGTYNGFRKVKNIPFRLKNDIRFGKYERELQGNRIKNFEKTQVANFQMIAFWRLYSKIKNALKTMVDNQVLTF
ncbi:hypothetical protein PGIN_13-1_01489 [Porphyromonas gingivalis]|nr:hypothetical protein PGIN_13-1_01489 [Porphyromonas gingivalis]